MNTKTEHDYIFLEHFFKEKCPTWSEAEIDHAAHVLEYSRPFPLACKTARELLQHPDNYRDFIYWKRFDLIFFNIQGITTHQMFISNLFDIEVALNENITVRQAYDNHELKWPNYNMYEKKADQWILDSYGFFLSSVAKNITMGEDYKFTEQHKRLFKGLGIRRIEK